MADQVKRPKDLPRVTSVTAGDSIALDGATTRSIEVDDLLTSTNLSFTQGGTGAVPVTIDSVIRGLVVTPQMFGAKTGLVNDATAGIQAAIDYLSLSTGGLGGTVSLPPGLYKTTAQVVISSPGISLVGAQAATGNGTEIYFVPSVNGQAAFSLTAGAGIISNCQIRNLSVRSPDTTRYKIGIVSSDSSNVILRDLFIYGFFGGPTTTITGAAANGSGEVRLTVASSAAFSTGWSASADNVVGTTEANFGWPIAVIDATHIDLKGSTFTNAYVSGGTITASSVGLQTKGREFYTVDNVNIKADIPIRMSVDPNLPQATIDQSNFNNMSLFATGTNPIVMVDDGGAIGSLKFSGTQSWHFGKDGFAWRDRSSVQISQQVSFSNVRAEQKTALGGTYFKIDLNQTLYSLQIVNPLMSDRDGFYLRNIANVQIDCAHYISLPGFKAMDIDASVGFTQINGSYWSPSSTATLTGQNVLFYVGKTGGLPSFGTYSSTLVRNQSASIDSSGSITAVSSIQSGATGVLGSVAVKGSTSGIGTLIAQAVQGTPNVLFPTGGGTMAVSASAPLAVNATTGNMTLSGGNLPATATNDNASAGNLGQYVESVVSSGSAVPITSGTQTDVTFIDLTAGDWDVDAVVYHKPAAGTSYTRYAGGISTTSATLDVTPGRFADFSQAALVSSTTFNDVIPPMRFSVAVTTRVYLVALGFFTVSTAAAYGIIRARRVR